MLLKFPEICFEDLHEKKLRRAKSSAITVSMQSKSGTGGAINVGSDDDDDDDGSVDPDFVS